MNASKHAEYWNRRRHSVYLRQVDTIVSAVGARAGSLIDIGSKECEYINWFGWIPDRVSLDINKPYSGAGVRTVVADFLKWAPDKRYDVALCLQVLEHIDDAASFASKLYGLADHLVVSVPYKWKESNAGHVQDPISLSKFIAWFPSPPTWSSVVAEPLLTKNDRRIVAYFDTKMPDSQRFTAARSRGIDRMNKRSPIL